MTVAVRFESILSCLFNSLQRHLCRFCHFVDAFLHFRQGACSVVRTCHKEDIRVGDLREWYQRRCLGWIVLFPIVRIADVLLESLALIKLVPIVQQLQTDSLSVLGLRVHTLLVCVTDRIADLVDLR